MDPGATKCSSKTIVLTGYGGYDQLKIEIRPIPKPSISNVIINVVASGVNFAELMCRQGTYDRTPKVPAVLGMEAAGVVVDVGDGVDTPKVGDCFQITDKMLSISLSSTTDKFELPCIQGLSRPHDRPRYKYSEAFSI
jgi:hypothetical protein